MQNAIRQLTKHLHISGDDMRESSMYSPPEADVSLVSPLSLSLTSSLTKSSFKKLFTHLQSHIMSMSHGLQHESEKRIINKINQKSKALLHTWKSREWNVSSIISWREILPTIESTENPPLCFMHKDDILYTEEISYLCFLLFLSSSYIFDILLYLIPYISPPLYTSILYPKDSPFHSSLSKIHNPIPKIRKFQRGFHLSIILELKIFLFLLHSSMKRERREEKKRRESEKK